MNETTATPTTDATGAAIGSRVDAVVRCPFCGYPVTGDYYPTNKYARYCLRCHAQGPWADTMSEAMQAWEQRTSNASLEARAGKTKNGGSGDE